MARRKRLAPALLLAAALAAPAGAEPPPHAPAHGYRHKHSDGIALVFDAHFGVYAVAERARHFFHRGLFFRLREGHWQRAAHVRGPWKRLAPADVPTPVRGLAKKRGLPLPGRVPGPKGPAKAMKRFFKKLR